MAKVNTWDDHYARRARKEKWPARSVYKLEEIDRRFKLIPPGARLLDLGCSPGSWTQYALKKTGPRGHVVGVDLNVPGLPQVDNFRFIQADILSLDPDRLLHEIGERDLVISDLAPGTTGVKSSDAARSAELVRSALVIARILLRPGGHFLCKVFEGEDIQDLRREIAESFEKVRSIRPKAVRKGSREIYLLATSLRQHESLS
ncbi:MAG: RlmE family RNA methyltransferase [Thermodesulfobacteriota bacterium]